MLSPYEGGRFRVTQKFTLGVHDGLDIVGESSKTLVALCDGTVLASRIVTDKSDLTWQWGNYVTVASADGARITYAHLSKRLVKAGDAVRAGDPVGVEGNTGYSFGAHCHLEVRGAANRPTAAINTPAFTGIPNAPGSYDAGEGEPDESALDALECRIAALEGARPVFRHFGALPDYARATIEAMYREGLFAGSGPDDLDLTRNIMRMLLILRWRGVL